MTGKRLVSWVAAVAGIVLAAGCAPSKPKGARQAPAGASDIAVAAQ